MLHVVHHPRESSGWGVGRAASGDVNDRQFQIDPDGSYSLVLSATEQPGNWLRLDPDAYCVVVRSYFQLGTSAQNDMDVSVRIDIERLKSWIRHRR